MLAGALYSRLRIANRLLGSKPEFWEQEADEGIMACITNVVAYLNEVFFEVARDQIQVMKMSGADAGPGAK
jgi:hypothetical protein